MAQSRSALTGDRLFEVHSEVDGKVAGSFDEEEARRLKELQEERFGHEHWVEQATEYECPDCGAGFDVRTVWAGSEPTMVSGWCERTGESKTFFEEGDAR